MLFPESVRCLLVEGKQNPILVEQAGFWLCLSRRREGCGGEAGVGVILSGPLTLEFAEDGGGYNWVVAAGKRSVLKIEHEGSVLE